MNRQLGNHGVWNPQNNAFMPDHNQNYSYAPSYAAQQLGPNRYVNMAHQPNLNMAHQQSVNMAYQPNVPRSIYEYQSFVNDPLLPAHQPPVNQFVSGPVPMGHQFQTPPIYPQYGSVRSYDPSDPETQISGHTQFDGQYQPGISSNPQNIRRDIDIQHTTSAEPLQIPSVGNPPVVYVRRCSPHLQFLGYYYHWEPVEVVEHVPPDHPSYRYGRPGSLNLSDLERYQPHIHYDGVSHAFVERAWAEREAMIAAGELKKEQAQENIIEKTQHQDSTGEQLSQQEISFDVRSSNSQNADDMQAEYSDQVVSSVKGNQNVDVINENVPSPNAQSSNDDSQNERNENEEIGKQFIQNNSLSEITLAYKKEALENASETSNQNINTEIVSKKDDLQSETNEKQMENTEKCVIQDESSSDSTEVYKDEENVKETRNSNISVESVSKKDDLQSEQNETEMKYTEQLVIQDESLSDSTEDYEDEESSLETITEYTEDESYVSENSIERDGEDINDNDQNISESSISLQSSEKNFLQADNDEIEIAQDVKDSEIEHASRVKCNHCSLLSADSSSQSNIEKLICDNDKTDNKVKDANNTPENQDVTETQDQEFSSKLNMSSEIQDCSSEQDTANDNGEGSSDSEDEDRNKDQEEWIRRNELRKAKRKRKSYARRSRKRQEQKEQKKEEKLKEAKRLLIEEKKEEYLKLMEPVKNGYSIEEKMKMSHKYYNSRTLRDFGTERTIIITSAKRTMYCGMMYLKLMSLIDNREKTLEYEIDTLQHFLDDLDNGGRWFKKNHELGADLFDINVVVNYHPDTFDTYVKYLNDQSEILQQNEHLQTNTNMYRTLLELLLSAEKYLNAGAFLSTLSTSEAARFEEIIFENNISE